VAWPQIRLRREGANLGRLPLGREAVPTARAELGDPDGSLDPLRRTYPREQSRLIRADQHDARQPGIWRLSVRRWMAVPNGDRASSRSAKGSCRCPPLSTGCFPWHAGWHGAIARPLGGFVTSRVGSRRRPYPSSQVVPEASAARTCGCDASPIERNASLNGDQATAGSSAWPLGDRRTAEERDPQAERQRRGGRDRGQGGDRCGQDRAHGDQQQAPVPATHQPAKGPLGRRW